MAIDDMRLFDVKHQKKQKHRGFGSNKCKTHHICEKKRGYPQQAARISSTDCEDILNGLRGYPQWAARISSQKRLHTGMHDACDIKKAEPLSSARGKGLCFILHTRMPATSNIEAGHCATPYLRAALRKSTIFFRLASSYMPIP